MFSFYQLVLNEYAVTKDFFLWKSMFQGFYQMLLFIDRHTISSVKISTTETDDLIQ